MDSKLESTSFETPAQLNDKLIEKCEDFETVCDQIYFILVRKKKKAYSTKVITREYRNNQNVFYN